MNHPPIPPNCKYFVFIGADNSWIFEWPTFGCGQFVKPVSDIELASGDERKIIATIARCAWIDASFECSRFSESRDKCEKNADEWKSWGEQKQ